MTLHCTIKMKCFVCVETMMKMLQHYDTANDKQIFRNIFTREKTNNMGWVVITCQIKVKYSTFVCWPMIN